MPKSGYYIQPVRDVAKHVTAFSTRFTWVAVKWRHPCAPHTGKRSTYYAPAVQPTVGHTRFYNPDFTTFRPQPTKQLAAKAAWQLYSGVGPALGA